MRDSPLTPDKWVQALQKIEAAARTATEAIKRVSPPERTP